MNFQLTGCTLEQLRSMAQRTLLSEKCAFLYHTVNILDISRGFRQLIDSTTAWELEHWKPILACVCTLYLVNTPSDTPRQMRGKLIARILQSPFIECLDPMKVHEMVDYLLDQMGKENINAHSNILYLALTFSAYAWRGRPLAVCLLWALISCSVKLEITMHRYREIDELIVAIKREPNYIFTEKTAEQLQQFLLLLQAINKLIILLIFTDNKELFTAGYPKHFFEMERKDVEFMRNWIKKLMEQYNLTQQNVPYGIGVKIIQCLESSVHLFDNIQGTESADEDQMSKIMKANQDTYSDLSDDDV